MRTVNLMRFISLVFVVFAVTLSTAFAFENLVYTWRGFPAELAQGTVAIEDLKAHAAQIDILSSQAYHIDEKGVVYGSLNPQMVEIAKNAHVKLMPLVGNKDFDRALAHTFLNDPAAQDRAMQTLLQLCKQNHFAGLQIDFEGMSFLDRDAFTHFYQKIAGLLHQNGFQVSIAIIPTLTDDAPATAYLKGKYEYWSGVYDYKALGNSSDFITLMAYDQHGNITTPGPVAGFSWDEGIVQYALRYLPPEKISLGIPWHSGYWYTGKNSDTNALRTVSVDLTYVELLRFMKDHQLSFVWDNADKVHYAMFRNNFLYEYLFAEDAASFSAKLDLVKKYKLRGLSSWCLGEEDPGIWGVLEKQYKR